MVVNVPSTFTKGTHQITKAEKTLAEVTKDEEGKQEERRGGRSKMEDQENVEEAES